MKRSGIQRKARLQSSGPPERRTRIKSVNRKRRASEFERCYGSKERVAWVKSRKCVYCVSLSPFIAEANLPSDNAHVCGNDGAGRKGHFSDIVPLCRTHHRRFDEHRAPFDTLDMREWVRRFAPIIDALWSAHLHQQTGAGTT